MRDIAAALLLVFACTAASAAEPAGRWLLITDLWGNPSYQALELTRDGDRLAGTLDGDMLSGARAGRRLHFDVSSKDASYAFDGNWDADAASGKAEYPDSNDAARRVTHSFRARRIPARPAGAARRYDYEPRDYSNEFSPHRAPVLTIWPGDRVRTTTVDSGGVDAHGTTRALFGNPQTGPFYIDGALPGDTLVVHLERVRLNRDYADSLDAIVGRVLGSSLASKAGNLGKSVRWKLDREHNVARLQDAPPRLRDVSVPLRPMLGGLAVAPGFGSAPMSTGDTGRFGGNMDFNEVVEGATIYLPVFQPGALLYLGDAHAAQGDGETAQYALETSMDVEFSVDVRRGQATAMPRVESATRLMALGQAGSLDEATRAATTGLIQWLQADYGLDLAECASLLGSSVHYTIANLAGRSVGVAAALDKERLVSLAPTPPVAR